MNAQKNCIVCGRPLEGEPLLLLDHMPASAQDIPDQSQIAQDHGINLRLCQCRSCGLVQFDCEPVSYYRDVIRSGGFSTTMVELRRSQYRKLIENYGLQGKTFLEVGCGRGEFLSVLTEFPVKCFGIEHNSELAKLAAAQGLKVWQAFAENSDTSLLSPEGDGPYDVFLSFNFLEHQPEPSAMLSCIYENLTEGGMGLITVPSLEYILLHDGYYELIRDHIAYYTFDTLRYLLEKNGFSVLEEEMVNRDTLSVVVKKTGKKMERQILEDTNPSSGQSQRLKPMDTAGLRGSRSIINSQVDQLIDELREDGKRLSVWGASHQGFTLAATTRLGDKASYILDSAAFKQGRYAPASHVPIVAPDYFEQDPVDAILIVAPGYTDEIFKSIRERFGKEVEVYTLRSSHIEKLK